MDDPSFKEYIEKHGYHFTDSLALTASDMMINSNGVAHKWTPEQIELQLKLMNITDYGCCTLGDLTYLANMAYADYFPTVLATTNSCIEYAVKTATDPDGYDGMPFSRWLADIIRKDVTSINWSQYV